MTSESSSALGLEFAAMELVASHARDVFIVTDALGKTVWVNEAFVRATGYSREEVIGCRPGDLLQGPRTNPKHRAALGQAIRNRVPVRVQILNYTKAGVEYWVDIELSPVFADSGALRYFVAVERDVTESRHLEERYRDFIAVQKALNRQAIVSSADRLGRINYVNDHFCDVSGYSREELVGQDHRMVNSGYHPSEFFTQMWRQIMVGGTWHGQICNRAKDGSHYWVDTTVVPVMNSEGAPERFLSIRFDITQRKQVELELQRLVAKDELTGLGNRREFLSGLEALEVCGRRKGDCGEALVLLIDLDHFKRINDTRGHPAGDAVLCEVGQRLSQGVREGDSVARLGGDEFGVILRDGPQELSQIASIVQRLMDGLCKPIVLEGGDLRPSFSVGVARYPADGADGETLVKHADLALYAAKRDGRGVVRHFDPVLGEALDSELGLEQDLRAAIEQDTLELYWQPQVLLDGAGLRGFEVLARWQRGEQFVAPGVFIPLAERTGLILPLGSLLLRKALEQLSELVALGVDPGVIAINVSPVQLQHPAFFEGVHALLNEFDVDPARLEMEITETALLGPSLPVVREHVQSLHELGVGIALDDFGTGYSSLTLLKQFPVDVLKIDRSFVGGLQSSAGDREIVRAVVGLGRNLNMRVVGEGVESECIGEELAALGCHFGQGYHYAKPMPVDHVIAYLQRTGEALQPTTHLQAPGLIAEAGRT